MKTYYQFIQEKYDGLGAIKKHYPGFRSYRDNYIECYRFQEWLETLRDQSISLTHVNSLVKVYIEHSNIKVADTPSLLASISRFYNVELPEVYGLLTPDYWARFFNNK